MNEIRQPVGAGPHAGLASPPRFLTAGQAYLQAVRARSILAHATALAGVPLWMSVAIGAFRPYLQLAAGLFAVSAVALAGAAAFEVGWHAAALRWARRAGLRTVR